MTEQTNDDDAYRRFWRRLLGQEPERPKPNGLAHLTPMTDDDLLRLADRPGGVNDQLRAAQDHADGGTT